MSHYPIQKISKKMKCKIHAFYRTGCLMDIRVLLVGLYPVSTWDLKRCISFQYSHKRLIKWGTCIQWSSSKHCYMRNSCQMTIGKTHPTILAQTSPNLVVSRVQFLSNLHFCTYVSASEQFDNCVELVRLSSSFFSLPLSLTSVFDFFFFLSSFLSLPPFPADFSFLVALFVFFTALSSF